MAMLVRVYEKFENHQLQVIELVAKANSREEAANLGYDDFKANLYINHQLIGDISPVLSKTDAFTRMVDEHEWEDIYQEVTEGITA